ncbi:DUF4333 domain-containing protein [Flindersiella endophytica]
MKTRMLALASLLALGAAVAGCSGDPTLKEADLEKSVKDTLAKQVGQTPDSIDCPGDLTGKTGTTMRCTLKAGGDELGLTVTVTGVEGSTVKYDVKVDEQ